MSSPFPVDNSSRINNNRKNDVTSKFKKWLINSAEERKVKV
jgi:hypothetical protein